MDRVISILLTTSKSSKRRDIRKTSTTCIYIYIYIYIYILPFVSDNPDVRISELLLDTTVVYPLPGPNSKYKLSLSIGVAAYA